jgi:phosphoribosylformimino-5-aminoimidazole carboxamide ribotide isomerase
LDLIAAIDLLGGRAVRLRQGDYRQPIASVEPLELAARWAASGVPWLHVVDLEGARSGQPRQLSTLTEVFRAAREAAADSGAGIRLQAGGGLRTEDAVATVLDAGADALVLGTAAIEHPGFMAACARRWPDRILAALDLRGGRLAVDGWLRTEAAEPRDAAARLLDEGAAGLVVTDTWRDGQLVGPNLVLMEAFRNAFPESRLIASGGIRSIGDLLDLERAGVDGAIVGLALLSGSFSAAEAVAALRRPPAPVPT